MVQVTPCSSGRSKGVPFASVVFLRLLVGGSWRPQSRPNFDYIRNAWLPVHRHNPTTLCVWSEAKTAQNVSFTVMMWTMFPWILWVIPQSTWTLTHKISSVHYNTWRHNVYLCFNGFCSNRGRLILIVWHYSKTIVYVRMLPWTFSI